LIPASRHRLTAVAMNTHNATANPPNNKNKLINQPKNQMKGNPINENAPTIKIKQNNKTHETI